MVASVANEGIQSLRVEKEIFIAAPLDIAFESLLEELGPESALPGKPMPMVIEAWPGGRWFRDLGNQSGHFWGHVQVIKPPALLEICGPFFMSFPGVNHLQYRLTAEGTGTKLKLVHRGFGEIPAEVKEGVDEGWGSSLDRVLKIAESRMKSKC
jgi:hypothetical protein